MPFRNAAATIEEAGASVLADMDGDDELVAIDDHSTDGGRDRLPRDRRIVVLTNTGKGIVSALSAGIAASRGELLTRMDADDVSLPGRLAASRALLDRDLSLGVAATCIETIKGEGLAAYVSWQNATVSKEEHSNAIFVESPICHPAATIRRAALEAVGGYHDPVWPEDWDLWLRLVERAFGIAKVPEVLFRWRRHDAALTVTDPRYSEERMRECRAHYLARRLEDRPFAIWGAGQTGRRLARALEGHAIRPRVFVDIDPKKHKARELDVIRPEALDRDLFVVVAVGAPGARDIVRGRLLAAGRREGIDFLCAA
jgi:glycosyltransferase involved in cell wall biosynthesis